MRATLPTPPAAIATLIRGLLRTHRAGLRSRTSATAAFDPPAAPCALVPVTTADGTALRVHAYGPADGHVIVLVHGWTCCLEYWNPQINAFAGDYRVVAYDQRGHGETEFGPSPLTTDLLADDLAAVLAAVLRPGQRAVVVGHSLGGMAVQAWAARYPERVRADAAAVVLTNTAPGNLVEETTVLPLLNRGGPRLPRSIGRYGLGGPLLFPPIAPVRWLFRHRILSAAATRDVTDFSLAIVRSCPAWVRSRFGFLLADLELGRAAVNLTVPTTVIAGAADNLTPPVHSRRIAAMLTEAGSLDRLVVLPTGHLGNLEARAAFDAEVARVAAAAFTVREIPA